MPLLMFFGLFLIVSALFVLFLFVMHLVRKVQYKYSLYSMYSVLAVSVQDGDAAVSHGTRWQQRGTEGMCDRVQHCNGVQLVKHQRLTRPVQQQADLLGFPCDLQGHLIPPVAKGIVPIVVGQHPRLTVVAQSGLVPRAFALQRGVADPNLKGSTLAYPHHPAVGARGHGQ